MPSSGTYIDLLQDELADAKRRYAQAGIEGRTVIKNQISQIERDISRNTAKYRDAQLQQREQLLHEASRLSREAT